MKSKLNLLIYLLWCFASYGYSQNLPFDTLLNRGKSEFKKDSGNNYVSAIANLNKAILLKPNNSEAHYFLAYAYSRINSSEASTIGDMKLPLVIKASEQLEKVIKLSPLYTGEIVVLDPYSKLTSEWGAMATSYIINNKLDSAKWTLEEGKKRGGFDAFILSECKLALESCSQNSVLISCGDNYYFPFLYLQQVEHFRPDISIIDIDMLNTKWFPNLLVNKEGIKFDIKEPVLDTLDYKQWSDSIISIPIYGTNEFFKWILLPSYEKSYILRGDRLFLSFLKENKFKRDIYFTTGFVDDEQLSLTAFLQEFPTINKLSVRHEQNMTDEQIVIQIKNYARELKPVNKNSPFESYPLENFRCYILNKICFNLKVNKKPEATLLLNALNEYLPESKYPYVFDGNKSIAASLKKQTQ